MGLEEKDNIIKALKAEGYKINDVIMDAIDELIEVVEDENENMADDDEEEEDD